ncbi:hypothetical protein BKA57DRAFT_457285 [Linnemannia elongata]|nr:hypothetical protein BKA57DRAFT_457285 [Linnemannia elongata]
MCMSVRIKMGVVIRYPSSAAAKEIILNTPLSKKKNKGQHLALPLLPLCPVFSPFVIHLLLFFFMSSNPHRILCNQPYFPLLSLSTNLPIYLRLNGYFFVRRRGDPRSTVVTR